MIFGNAWGLLALLGIPIILVIHLFRQRFQARQTSTLFLFGPEEFSSISGRTP